MKETVYAMETKNIMIINRKFLKARQLEESNGRSLALCARNLNKG